MAMDQISKQYTSNSKSSFYRELKNLGSMKTAASIVNCLKQNEHIGPYIGQLFKGVVSIQIEVDGWKFYLIQASSKTQQFFLKTCYQNFVIFEIDHHKNSKKLTLLYILIDTNTIPLTSKIMNFLSVINQEVISQTRLDGIEFVQSRRYKASDSTFEPSFDV